MNQSDVDFTDETEFFDTMEKVFGDVNCHDFKRVFLSLLTENNKVYTNYEAKLFKEQHNLVDDDRFDENAVKHVICAEPLLSLAMEDMRHRLKRGYDLEDILEDVFDSNYALSKKKDYVRMLSDLTAKKKYSNHSECLNEQVTCAVFAGDKKTKDQLQETQRRVKSKMNNKTQSSMKSEEEFMKNECSNLIKEFSDKFKINFNDEEYKEYVDNLQLVVNTLDPDIAHVALIDSVPPRSGRK